jgi:hypothetical protein
MMMAMSTGAQGGWWEISDLVPFLLRQLGACEKNHDGLLPASQAHTNSWVSNQGRWDLFLFPSNNAQEIQQPVEKARGLFHVVQSIEFEESTKPCNILRCQSRDRLHFCGFIADLINKLELSDFETALESTIAEWRNRWALRVQGLTFIERVGLFGELVVLRDFLQSGVTNDAGNWVARDEGDGLHDFVFEYQIFETKSTVQGLGDIHIFHENQLHHVEGLHLLLVKLSQSEIGESIDDIIGTILALMDSDQSRSDFLKKVASSGFAFNEYTDDRFLVQERLHWESVAESPFIQLDDFDRSIRKPNDISYHVVEDDVDFSEINDFSELTQ